MIDSPTDAKAKIERLADAGGACDHEYIANRICPKCFDALRDEALKLASEHESMRLLHESEHSENHALRQENKRLTAEVERLNMILDGTIPGGTPLQTGPGHD